MYEFYYIILWTPWPYATDPQGSPDPTLRTIAIKQEQ